jgi:hypothetical protein
MGTKTYKRLFQRLVVTGTPQSTESLGKNPNIVPMTKSLDQFFGRRLPLEFGTTNDSKCSVPVRGSREF